MLGQNKATRGFLFFRVPDETPGFDQATLVLDLPADGAEISSIKVVVTGLGYRAGAGSGR